MTARSEIRAIRAYRHLARLALVVIKACTGMMADEVDVAMLDPRAAPAAAHDALMGPRASLDTELALERQVTLVRRVSPVAKAFAVNPAFQDWTAFPVTPAIM